MTVRGIRIVGDPILRERCKEVTNFNSINGVVTDLRDTLADFRNKNGFGSGIAAPQVGYVDRVIYISTPKFDGEMINPRIAGHGIETGLFWDECFSFELAFFAKVERWLTVEIEYSDSFGNIKMIKADDEHLSNLLQHEIDHLDGILFVDKAVKDGDYILTPSAWKKLGKPLRVR